MNKFGEEKRKIRREIWRKFFAPKFTRNSEKKWEKTVKVGSFHGDFIRGVSLSGRGCAGPRKLQTLRQSHGVVLERLHETAGGTGQHGDEFSVRLRDAALVFLGERFQLWHGEEVLAVDHDEERDHLRHASQTTVQVGKVNVRAGDQESFTLRKINCSVHNQQ